MHSSKDNCFFIILPHRFFFNIGASYFYLDGSLKCNKKIYKIKDIWMRHTEVNKMTHIPWKCEQHLNDANPLVAATWSKPLNNFDRVRNLPASIFLKT
jgi:ferritin